MMSMSDAQLAKLAKTEGKLVLYSGQSEGNVTAAVKGFGLAYPDVKVQVYRADAGTVQLRTLKEEAAGRAGADVVDLPTPQMGPVDDAGYLAKYTAAPSKTVEANAKFGNWTAARSLAFAPSWNTKLVSAADAPKSWEELADPKWKGKIALEMTDSAWYFALWTWFTTEGGKTPAQADAIFEGIAKNAVVVSGHSAAVQLLAAGQFSVFVDPYIDGTSAAKDAGSPVAYLPAVAPLILAPSGPAILKNAPDAAAAVLWTNWELSEAGQKVNASVSGVIPSVTAYQPAELKDVEKVAIDAKTYLAAGNKWPDKYKALLSGSKTVK
jgi:iron(III) transport system substrate-binding protein